MKKILLTLTVCSLFLVNIEQTNAQNPTLDPGDEPCGIIKGQWLIEYMLFQCTGYGEHNCRPASC